MRTDRVETGLATVADDGERVAPAGILAEITAGLAAGSDLDAQLQRFLGPIVRLAGAQAGAARVLSDTGEQLLLVSSVGLPPGVCGSERVVDRHCGHCGTAADTQTVVWASNLSVCGMRTDGDFFGKIVVEFP